MQGNKPLTTKAIEAMKPNDPDKADIGEYRGLRVTCGLTGKKTFFYRFNDINNNRKQKQVKLGVFPILSLSQARVYFLELKRLRQQGICPATRLREERNQLKAKIENVEASKLEQAFTIQDMIELYLVERIEDRISPDGVLIAGARKKKGQAEVRRMLYSDVVKTLGRVPVVDVKYKDIIDLINSIISRGANVQAGAVLRELTASYDYSIGRGKLLPDFVNPSYQAKRMISLTKVKLSPKKRSRVFDESELKAFMSWLPGSGFSDVQKNILRMTLWTGCRTGELCNASWSDIDLEKGIFHIKETKTGTSRDVQLSRQAIEHLKFIRLSTDRYVFPSIITKKPILQKSLTETSWRLRKDGRMIQIPEWTPHDLRRTVRTGLAKLRCPNDVAEAVLGHSPKGIEGTYNLHRYDEECREWLQKWANYLEVLIK